jgi:hypothetical protein
MHRKSPAAFVMGLAQRLDAHPALRRLRYNLPGERGDKDRCDGRPDVDKKCKKSDKH